MRKLAFILLFLPSVTFASTMCAKQVHCVNDDPNTCYINERVPLSKIDGTSAYLKSNNTIYYLHGLISINNKEVSCLYISTESQARTFSVKTKSQDGETKFYPNLSDQNWNVDGYHNTVFCANEDSCNLKTID